MFISQSCFLRIVPQVFPARLLCVGCGLRSEANPFHVGGNSGMMRGLALISKIMCGVFLPGS